MRGGNSSGKNPLRYVKREFVEADGVPCRGLGARRNGVSSGKYPSTSVKYGHVEADMAPCIRLAGQWPETRGVQG